MAPRAILIGTVTVAALLAVHGGFSGPMRALPTLAFLLAIPGLAWCGHLERLKVPGLVAVAVSLSLAMDIATGCFMLILGLWSPNAGLWILMAATVSGLLCTHTGDRRSPRLPTGDVQFPPTGGDSLPQINEAAAAPIGHRTHPGQGASDPDNIDEPILIVCAVCANRTEQSYGWLLANPSPKCPTCGREMIRERDAVVAYVEGIRRLIAQVRARRGS